jgi:DNA modification methylase
VVRVLNQISLSFPDENIESLQPVCSILSSVDWSFKQRSRVPAIENIHPYPAKFIGEIPRYLIKCLPIPKGTIVLDPFCGSGTTLFEAQRAGLQSIGIDLNPIACLISRVKTSNFQEGFINKVQKIISKAQNNNSLKPPDIPNLDHWFNRDIQLAISALLNDISNPEYRPWSDQLKLSLSSILVRVSNQDSDTRYAAILKNVRRQDVFELFFRSAKKLSNALLDRTWELPITKVIEHDTLTVNPSQINTNVGLVITSPPYPNAYEYWLYHKYRMWWLGFDPISVKEKEIGARAHFFKKNHHTANHFKNQMEKTFKLINSVMVKGGYACFIVGRSKIHGEIVDNGNIIEQVADEVRFEKVYRVERELNANRKSFNLSHANIKTESLLVFKKTNL